MRHRHRVEPGAPRAVEATVPADRDFAVRAPARQARGSALCATASQARLRAPAPSADPSDVHHARIIPARTGGHARDATPRSQESLADATCRECIRDRFAELRERLLAGEAAVTGDELCGLVAPELRRQLRMWAPPNCRDLIEDAVDDTLSERISVRQQYDPSRGDPIAWLVTIARHKLVDAVRAIARRRQHEVPLTDELARGLQAPPSICSDELAERRAWLDRHRRRFLAMAKTAQERRFLEARLRGAPFDEQAVLLGAAHLPEAEQRALVNRVWQRLRVRLVRSLARSGHEPG